METRLVAGVIAILLWGIFLLRFDIPPMIGVAVSGFAFLSLFLWRMRIDRLGLLLLLNYFFWLLSGFSVGSIKPADFVNIEFLNGDGRIFIAYLPLLLMSVAVVNDGTIQALFRTLERLSYATLGLFIVWLPTHATILSEGAAKNFAGFLTSHTGAGTFFGLLSLASIVYGQGSGRRRLFWLGWIMLVPVFATASRASLLAFLAAFAWYLLKLRRMKLIVVTGSLLALAIASMPLIAPHTWQRTSALFSADLVDSIITTAENSTWGPGDSEEEIELAGSEVNVLMRVTIWTYAIKRFLESPFLGIGYARYNDYDLQRWGVRGLFFPATGGVRVLGVGNAHNSFVHVLCETGLFGLTLFLAVWAGMYFRLQRGIRRFAVLPESRALFITCQGVIIYCLITAMVGHGLAAPALLVPALSIVGIGLAWQRRLEGSLVVAPAQPPLAHAS